MRGGRKIRDSTIIALTTTRDRLLGGLQAFEAPLPFLVDCFHRPTGCSKRPLSALSTHGTDRAVLACTGYHISFGIRAMLKEPRRPPKLPTQQLLVLAICRFAEPVAMTSVFPYLVSAIWEECRDDYLTAVA